MITTIWLNATFDQMQEPLLSFSFLFINSEKGEYCACLACIFFSIVSFLWQIYAYLLIDIPRFKYLELPN